VEAYPISVDEVLSMNYVSELNANQERLFFDICTLVIGKKLSLSTDHYLKENNFLKKSMILKL
jgi:hypothetical protein